MQHRTVVRRVEDHGDDPPRPIKKVCNGLASNSPGTHIPGGDTIPERSNEFRTDVPVARQAAALGNGSRSFPRLSQLRHGMVDRPGKVAVPSVSVSAWRK
jgi:hypothetical protein